MVQQGRLGKVMQAELGMLRPFVAAERITAVAVVAAQVLLVLV